MTRFFFAEESPRPAALLRIALGVLLLCEAAVRWPSAIELFSSAGRPMPVFPGTHFEPPALDATATVAMHTLLLAALASTVAGWNTRISLLVAAVLSTWLGLLDLPGTYKKYTVISLHLTVLLSLTNSGGAWGLDAWLVRRAATGPAEAAPPSSPLWPRRLMQLFLCSVYFGAAVTKIRMPDFASGEMVEFALLGDEFGGKPAGHWLIGHPALLTTASMGTILFEVLFPFLVWVERIRRPMLVLAAAFHLALQITLHLGLFSWVMLTGLLVFLTDDDLGRIGLGRASTREPAEPSDAVGVAADGATRSAWPARFASVAVWMVAVSALVAGGVAWQRTADWYGVFGGHSVRGRIEAPQSLLDDVFLGQAPAYADYVHAMEIGARIANGRALGENEHFRRGMIVRAAARFLYRHPPLQLDWILIAPDGSEVARLSRRLDASATHANAGFELTSDAPPGRYRVILQTEGYEAAERTFEVVDP